MEKTNSHTILTSREEKGGIRIISSDTREVIKCSQREMYLWLKQLQPHKYIKSAKKGSEDTKLSVLNH